MTDVCCCQSLNVRFIFSNLWLNCCPNSTRIRLVKHRKFYVSLEKDLAIIEEEYDAFTK